jgi:serine/threonine-protein kinase HipA
MTPAFRTAYVYVRNTYAGRLSETDAGYSFLYDTDYLALPDASAVSLTLPLNGKAYTSKTIFSFFDGLIPEGWLLDVVSRNWKIDRSDRFGLLLVACRDSIGNVSIREEQP